MNNLNYLNSNLSKINWDFSNFTNEGLNSFIGIQQLSFQLYPVR